MGEITIDWEEGTYTGEVSNNVPNGQGTYTYADGSKYVGEFKDGNPWKGNEYDKGGNVTVIYSESVRKEK